MHVDLAHVSLGVHVVGLVAQTLRMACLASLLAVLGDSIPHTHHGLALNSIGARLGIDDLAALQRVVPEHLAIGAVSAVVGHLEAHSRQTRKFGVVTSQRGLGHDRVVLDSVAVDGGHVIGAVELAVKRCMSAHMARADKRPGVVHAVGLNVLATAGIGGIALEMIDIVHLVIGAGVERLAIVKTRAATARAAAIAANVHTLFGVLVA